MKSLDYVGFNKLRPNRIHLFCPACGRKMSNTERRPDDPKTAVLMHATCERCGIGMKDESVGYFDAQGRELDWETGKPYLRSRRMTPIDDVLRRSA